MEKGLKMEEALRKSEEKFRNIFESANDSMVYLDMSGKILEVNRKAVEMFGGSKEELLGKHFTKVGVLSPRDIPMTISAFAKVLAGKKATVNTCIKNKKGREIQVEVSASPMKIDGKIAGMLVIARDVTERKEAEERIRASEERYRSLVELAPDSVMTFDMKGVITSCNTAATRLAGYSKDEIVGKHFSKLGFLRARDIPKYLQLMSFALRGKVPKSLEVDCIRKDGTPYSSGVRFGLLRKGTLFW